MYACGLLIGTLSPEEWLVILSLVAVVVRIISDLPGLFIAWHKMLPKIKEITDKLKWRK